MRDKWHSSTTCAPVMKNIWLFKKNQWDSLQAIAFFSNKPQSHSLIPERKQIQPNNLVNCLENKNQPLIRNARNVTLVHVLMERISESLQRPKAVTMAHNHFIYLQCLPSILKVDNVNSSLFQATNCLLTLYLALKPAWEGWRWACKGHTHHHWGPKRIPPSLRCLGYHIFWQFLQEKVYNILFHLLWNFMP